MIDHRAYHDHFHHMLRWTHDTRSALEEVVKMAYTQGYNDMKKGAPSAVTPEAPVEAGHGAPGSTAPR
jgi:hypothetical protein